MNMYAGRMPDYTATFPAKYSMQTFTHIAYHSAGTKHSCNVHAVRHAAAVHTANKIALCRVTPAGPMAFLHLKL